jgi:hypothetical protein
VAPLPSFPSALNLQAALQKAQAVPIAYVIEIINIASTGPSANTFVA